MSESAPLAMVAAFGAPVTAVAPVPGSKSLTNRALLCAALASGPSVIENCASGDDTTAMLRSLVALGFEVREVAPSQVEVGGRGGRLDPGPLRMSAGLAGTTSRFLTALCALGPGPYVVDGEDRLRTRPMAPLHRALGDLGVKVRPLGEPGCVPVEISGPTDPQVNALSIPGDTSSQYLSALMMIAPLLPQGLRIRLTTPLISRPYVELTAQVMRAFGATEVHVGESEVRVASGGYRGAHYTIEPDASSASYPLAVAAVCGGEMWIPGLTRTALQGDLRFVDLLEEMGCEVISSSDGIGVRRNLSQPLRGLTVDMGDISDLVPTMAVVAAVADSPTTITGVGFIRHKESDRLGDLTAELTSLGVQISETADGVRIEPSRATLRAAVVQTHHDHRVAMAAAVLATAVDGVQIADPDVVTKSWPGFFAALETWRPR